MLAKPNGQQLISLYADQIIWVSFFLLKSTGIMLVGLFTMVLITESLPYCPEVMETITKNIHYQHHLTEAGPMSCFLEFDSTQQNGI